MLGWGLNIVVGLAGLLDLGYVAFYAVGRLFLRAACRPPSACRSGSACRSPASSPRFWGIMLGFPVLRLRGDYLAIVTLAFGEIIRLVLINWVDLTNGGAGISSIPARQLLRHSLQRRRKRLRRDLRARRSTPMHRIDLPLLPDPGAGAHHQLRHAAPAQAAGRARLGGAARGRDRLPLARHQHHQHQAHRLRAWAPCSAASPARSSPCGRASSRRRASTSSNRRSSSPSSCSAAWASQLGVAIAAVAMVGGPELLRNLGFLKRGVRRGLRPERIPPAALRPRHGGDDGVAAARPDFDARALRRS